MDHHQPIDRRMLLAGLGAAGALAATKSLRAGELDPPPGPVGPTMKPLDEVEPRIAINAVNTPGSAVSVFRIDQPGSYYLTGNIVGEVAKHGVVINADDVTIDLNGYALVGVPGSNSGISNNLVSRRVLIRNGVVRNWGQRGISLLLTSSNSSAIIENVIADSNGSDGFLLNNYGIVHKCTATSNGGLGFSAPLSGHVQKCIAVGNAGGGIVIGSLGIVQDCVTRSNAFFGIRVGSFTTVEHNVCGFNSAGAAGIRVTGRGNRIEGNNCMDNGVGVEVTAASNFIARNVCQSNSTNWSVVSGNRCLVVLGANSGAINGSSGGVSPGSSNPYANFTY